MALKFVLGVYGAPYTQQGASSAWHFANAALHKNHIIQQVFFHLDGALNANQFADVATDETTWITQWQQLAQTCPFDLLVCSTAAARRGIAAPNLAELFQLASTGQFISAVMQADRYLVFGG